MQFFIFLPSALTVWYVKTNNSKCLYGCRECECMTFPRLSNWKWLRTRARSTGCVSVRSIWIHHAICMRKHFSIRKSYSCRRCLGFCRLISTEYLWFIFLELIFDAKTFPQFVYLSLALHRLNQPELTWQKNQNPIFRQKFRRRLLRRANQHQRKKENRYMKRQRPSCGWNEWIWWNRTRNCNSLGNYFRWFYVRRYRCGRKHNKNKKKTKFVRAPKSGGAMPYPK